jgi:hypothetical protein
MNDELNTTCFQFTVHRSSFGVNPFPLREHDCVGVERGLRDGRARAQRGDELAPHLFGRPEAARGLFRGLAKVAGVGKLTF